MSLEQDLQHLAGNVTPSDAKRHAMKMRMEARIRPSALLSVIAEAQPEQTSFQALRGVILSRLQPLKPAPMIHSGFKWAAAFAMFVLIIRSMPLILLAPATQAELGVQLVPGPESVSVFTGGVWTEVTEPHILKNAVMIRTGSAGATLVMNDDGVLRLAADTTVKLHDLGDRPHLQSTGPTATLIRGKVWAFGLLPPIVEGLVIETSYGTLSVNAGSVSLEDDDKGVVTVAVYDRGATLQNAKQTSFLVSGEKAALKEGKTFAIQRMDARVFTQPWVQANLSQDAVHRSDIAKLQEERRADVAGILPTSFLYSAKRMAEEVDVLFTLTHDGRTEKRISQANTRLSEALALIKEGADTEASTQLAEYKTSLVALAAGEDDNLVKYLIKKQIADASVSLGTSEENPDASIQLLKDAVTEVGAALPEADLKPQDIGGYVLVDRLIRINQMLARGDDPAVAVSEYAEISPYIQGLLADTGGSHPLLQKEARSLLVNTSSLLKKLPKTDADPLLTAMGTDVSKYLPPEPEKIEELNAKWAAQVEAMRHRIIDNLITPGGRYNQLLVEMDGIRNDPDRGHLLRLLQKELPERLGEYVNTEIKKLGDELKERS